MSHKYDIWFCHCGNIQSMSYDNYDWLQNDYKNRFIIRICQNCGRAQKVWLSEFDDGFSINACEIKDVTLNPEDLQHAKIIMSKGFEVWVKNGERATSYFANTYFDEKGNRGCDTKRLINEVRDDEILQSISGYVSGIDWSGTKYERKFA